MLNWLLALVDRIFAVIGALVFFQIPLFMQQYVQRLAGHEAELSLQVKLLSEAAAKSGKTLEQFVNKFLASGDADFIHQGQIMQGMINRWHFLSESVAAMLNSTVLTRPFVFISHLDFDIAKHTFQSYEIGLLLTLEGAAYATVGLLVGFAVFYSLRKIFKLLRPALVH